MSRASPSTDADDTEALKEHILALTEAQMQIGNILDAFR